MLQTNQNWSPEIIKSIEDEMAMTVMKYEMEFNSLNKNDFSMFDLSEHQKVAGKPFIMTETFAHWINKVLNARRELPEFAEYRQILPEQNNIIKEEEKTEAIKEEVQKAEKTIETEEKK